MGGGRASGVPPRPRRVWRNGGGRCAHAARSSPNASSTGSTSPERPGSTIKKAEKVRIVSHG
ncbi:BQ5605_C002g01739 [Microbotryum silenes-dioicae]|uniref:BQ5605_C002g01739 protein n=1 Tax=Microbotryum silenes-dioicae TaxID=796604 RepID=A0A2X0P2J2_9BASI|nr:BQ5605_C002g01739 [Microbotryum silenes-dioicae]